MKALRTVFIASLTIVTMASCNREVMVDNQEVDLTPKTRISLTANEEAQTEIPGSRVILDFTQTFANKC